MFSVSFLRESDRLWYDPGFFKNGVSMTGLEVPTLNLKKEHILDRLFAIVFKSMLRGSS